MRRQCVGERRSNSVILWHEAKITTVYDRIETHLMNLTLQQLSNSKNLQRVHTLNILLLFLRRDYLISIAVEFISIERSTKWSIKGVLKCFCNHGRIIKGQLCRRGVKWDMSRWREGDFYKDFSYYICRRGMIAGLTNVEFVVFVEFAGLSTLNELAIHAVFGL